MSGPILIQGAMDVETDWLISQLEDCREIAMGTYSFWQGRAANTDLVVSPTGVGMVHCACATALGIMRFAPALVLNQGVAGGHRDDLHVGDIVVGESCIAIHDLATAQKGPGEGSDPFQWDLHGFDGGDAPKVYRGDPVWTARFISAPYEAGKRVAGRLGSGDIFNREYDRILWLREIAGEDCEDMESAATYQVCSKLGVPCLGVRILSNNELTGEEYRREKGLDLQQFVLSVLANH